MVEVRLKGVPNEDIVQGFPGIPATWPRIQGSIEIRPSPKDAIKETRSLGVSRVTVGLYRTDSIGSYGGKAAITGSRREQSFLVTKLKELWADSSDVYALDLPFTLSLPTNRPICASMSLGKHVETIYYIFVSVELKGQKAVVEHRRYPVSVKRYDTLSTFSAFHTPINREVRSTDHYVSLEYSLPVSAYGPRDVLTAQFKISCNVDWNKARRARLKRVSLELVQVIKFAVPATSEAQDGTVKAEEPVNGVIEKHPVFTEEAPPERRSRIAKVGMDLDDIRLDDFPAVQELSIEIPGPSLEDKDGIIPKDVPGIPNEGRVGFTSAGSLYKVEFVLVMKARFSHAKDIETEQPITISQFDHATSMGFMRAIVDSAELARLADKSPGRPVVYSRPLARVVEIR